MKPIFKNRQIPMKKRSFLKKLGGSSPSSCPSSVFPCAFFFLGFKVLVCCGPKTWKEVAERTCAGDVVHGKTAENGVKGRALHLVDPFGDSHGGIGHQEEAGNWRGKRGQQFRM
ncbi:hypothetical protein [Ferviditalea candida]|uniref:Uncharacterized protein n=1 Tax=Ferviditalea candida TaxID=3108399 RepID=A0ABU5ZKT2_9BACL|nr:hypothetical protein [Paenibacillaceae bacterium T2]